MSKNIEDTRGELMKLVFRAAEGLSEFDEEHFDRARIAFEEAVLGDELAGNHRDMSDVDSIRNSHESRFDVNEARTRLRSGERPSLPGFVDDLRIHEATLRFEAQDNAECTMTRLLGGYSCRVVMYGYRRHGDRAPFTPCAVCGQRLMAEGVAQAG